MTIVLVVSAGMLLLAATLLLVRIARGPTGLDRIIAFDVLAAVTICGLALDAARDRRLETLPVLVSLALLGFVGAVGVAAFTPGSAPTEGDRR